MKDQVERGDVWASVDGKEFMVINVIDLDNKTWVHYRLISKEEPKEFSCYKESFVERFRPQPLKY